MTVGPKLDEATLQRTVQFCEGFLPEMLDKLKAGAINIQSPSKGVHFPGSKGEEPPAAPPLLTYEEPGEPTYLVQRCPGSLHLAPPSEMLPCLPARPP